MFNHLKIGLKGYDPLQDSYHNGLHIHVELKPALEPKRCPYCQCSRLLSKGRYQRKVRHLDCFREPSTLVVHTRRFLCSACSRSFLPELPGIRPGRQSSELFRQSIYELHHQGVCARTIAQKQAIGEATVERIYQQFTCRKAAERIDLKCPQYLGIDEHTLHKGQRFCTTFCDLKNHRIFDVQPGRSEAELHDFLCKLKEKDRVRVVCIDLSSPYRRLIQMHFPNAQIVADRFHVVRILNYHFLQLARLLAPTLKSNRGYLAAMRKAPERLSSKQKQRLDELFETHPVLQPIYQQMHQLREIMNSKHQTKKQCRQRLKDLLQHIKNIAACQAQPMQTLARTLSNWLEPIACMWRFTRNNGITEGFHRKMKLIQRRAYGFKNFNNYRLRVIAQCG
ncbi:ISL3 family transposase [Roseibacillus persicicus]